MSKPRSKNAQRNYDIGYRHALKNIEPFFGHTTYPGYDDGYSDGESDRPSLEELTFDPMDEVNS